VQYAIESRYKELYDEVPHDLFAKLRIIRHQIVLGIRFTFLKFKSALKGQPKSINCS